jgi:hypothetical protein
MDTANKDVTTGRVKRSQQFFNKGGLFFYDLLLYGLISKYAWGSSIQRLDSHYKRYVTHNHLEVGVGTGFLLNRVVFDSTHPRLALNGPESRMPGENKAQSHTVWAGNLPTKSVGTNSVQD